MKEKTKEPYSEPSFIKHCWMLVLPKLLAKKTWSFSKMLYDGCDLANLNYSQVRDFAGRLIREPEKVDFERKRLNVLLNMRHGEDNDK